MSEEEYEVETILQARLVKKPRKSSHWEFHVKWKGYESSENTWEPIESFDGSEHLLERFWERANTGGRDVKNIHLFTAGENFYPTGPPIAKIPSALPMQTASSKTRAEPPPSPPIAPARRKTTERETATRKLSGLKATTSTRVASQPVKPQSSKFRMTFTISDNGDNPDILKHIRGTLTHPQHGTVATIDIVRIDRTNCRGRFLDIMSSQEADLALLASELFDNNGNLRIWHYGSPKWRGSGCWKTEMNNGALFNVRSITASDSLPDNAPLSPAIQCLLKSEHVKKDDFVLSHLATVPSSRTHGFRRIGLTEFFAWTPETRHSSRLLHASEDTYKAETCSRHTFPIQFAIAYMEASEAESIIRNCHSADPNSIHRPDDNGFTPVQIAAVCSHLTATRMLLELGVGRAEILSRDNADRVTAMESVQNNISASRDFASGMWFSFGEPKKASLQDEESMEALLKQAIGDIVDPVCTCGVCEEGWLSSRMGSCLQKTARQVDSEMRQKLFSFPAAYREALSEEQFREDRLLRYIPASIEVHRTFYRGYHGVVIIIERILASRVHPKIPFVASVCAYINELSHYNKREIIFFIDKGGRVHHVLDCLISIASASGGSHQDIGDSMLLGPESDANLPICANDIDFDLVRRKLGL